MGCQLDPWNPETVCAVLASVIDTSRITDTPAQRAAWRSQQHDTGDA